MQCYLHSSLEVLINLSVKLYDVTANGSNGLGLSLVLLLKPPRSRCLKQRDLGASSGDLSYILKDFAGRSHSLGLVLLHPAKFRWIFLVLFLESSPFLQIVFFQMASRGKEPQFVMAFVCFNRPKSGLKWADLFSLYSCKLCSVSMAIPGKISGVVGKGIQIHNWIPHEYLILRVLFFLSSGISPT